MNRNVFIEGLNKAVGLAQTYVAKGDERVEKLIEDVADFAVDIYDFVDDKLPKDEATASASVAEDEGENKSETPYFVRERSLRDKLTFIINNSPSSDALNSMKVFASVREQMLTNHSNWIEKAYDRLIKEMTEEWRKAQW